jgi:hypothetical protein
VNLVTQKSAKKKSKKTTTAAEQSVLGSLRATRPTRIGGERRASKPAATRTKPATVKPVKPIAPKPKAAPTRVPPREPDGRPSGPPRGGEIVTTAVQAAGELAQIGATVGAQLLKRAARRIPRP